MVCVCVRAARIQARFAARVAFSPQLSWYHTSIQHDVHGVPQASRRRGRFFPLLLPKSRLYRRNHALPRRRPDRVHHDGPLRIRAVRELCVATARLRVNECSSNSDLKIARRSSVLRERDDDGVAECSTQTLSHCAGVPRVPSPAAVLNVHNGLRHCNSGGYNTSDYSRTY